MTDSDEKTRVTTIVQKPDGSDKPKGNDCLVVIYTKEPTLLGKRFVLDSARCGVGRGSENQIVLEGDSVSRKHCHFEQRNAIWWAVDASSEEAALGLLPFYVAQRTTVSRVSEVRIP